MLYTERKQTDGLTLSLLSSLLDDVTCSMLFCGKNNNNKKKNEKANTATYIKFKEL